MRRPNWQRYLRLSHSLYVNKPNDMSRCWDKLLRGCMASVLNVLLAFLHKLCSSPNYITRYSRRLALFIAFLGPRFSVWLRSWHRESGTTRQKSTPTKPPSPRTIASSRTVSLGSAGLGENIMACSIVPTSAAGVPSLQDPPAHYPLPEGCDVRPMNSEEVPRYTKGIKMQANSSILLLHTYTCWQTERKDVLPNRTVNKNIPLVSLNTNNITGSNRDRLASRNSVIPTKPRLIKTVVLGYRLHIPTVVSILSIVRGCVRQ
jgi:hypothetical protein